MRLGYRAWRRSWRTTRRAPPRPSTRPAPISFSVGTTLAAEDYAHALPAMDSGETAPDVGCGSGDLRRRRGDAGRGATFPERASHKAVFARPFIIAAMANVETRIGGRLLGRGHRPMIVAELSANHNASLDRALRIVHAAAECGADCIKLQTSSRSC